MLARSLAGAVLLLSLGMALVSPAAARAEPEVNLAPGLTVDVSGESGFSVAGGPPASNLTAHEVPSESGAGSVLERTVENGSIDMAYRLEPRLGTGAGVEGTGYLEALQSKAVCKLKGNDRLVLGQEDNRPVLVHIGQSDRRAQGVGAPLRRTTAGSHANVSLPRIGCDGR